VRALMQNIPELVYAFSVALQMDHATSRIAGEPTTRGVSYGLIAVDGGEFRGPRLSGIVLPGGGDAPEIRADGWVVFDATYVLREDDGTLIRVRNRGLREPSAATPGADGAGLYFRTLPRFDVPAGPHDWLGRTLFVGTGRRTARGNQIDYYAITRPAQ
jgi:hypothetical protein